MTKFLVNNAKAVTSKSNHNISSSKTKRMTSEEIKCFNQSRVELNQFEENYPNELLLKQLVNNECVNNGDGTGTEYKNIDLIEAFLNKHLKDYNAVTIEKLNLGNDDRPALFVNFKYNNKSIIGIALPDEENGGDYGAKLALKKMISNYPDLISKQDTLIVHFHVDVVPATKESWIQNPDTKESNPFNAFIKDNKIYGRGTMDMLSFGSEFLISFVEFIQKTKSDELTDNRASSPNQNKSTPDVIVVGEPPFSGCALSGEKGKINLTSKSAKQGPVEIQKTYRHATIHFKNLGSCGHGAIIQNPDNPVYAASLFANLSSENIIISNVTSSKENENSPNLIAKEVVLEIHYPDDVNIESIRKKIESKTNIKPTTTYTTNKSEVLDDIANFKSSLNDIYTISTHAHEPHITQDNWDAYIDGMELPSVLKLIPHTWIDFLNRNISSYAPQLKLLFDFTMDTIKPLSVSTNEGILSATYDYRPIHGSETNDVLNTLNDKTNVDFEPVIQRYAFSQTYNERGFNLMTRVYRASVQPTSRKAIKPLVTPPLPACTDGFHFYDQLKSLDVNLSIFTFPVGPPAKIAQGCYHHTTAEYIDIDMLKKMGDGFTNLLNDFIFDDEFQTSSNAN